MLDVLITDLDLSEHLVTEPCLAVLMDPNAYYMLNI
jgi:hypothetical protein